MKNDFNRENKSVNYNLNEIYLRAEKKKKKRIAYEKFKERDRSILRGSTDSLVENEKKE